MVHRVILRSARGHALLGASVAAVAIGLMLPGAAQAGVQAAEIPDAAAQPGSPTHVDPAPAQTAIVPSDPARDEGAVTTPQDPADPASADIVVTGFRRSLDAALNVKRESVAAVDVIVAEDIAKFPDQNLAESLQRVPGITIQRSGGEGSRITVRGLGSQFTRVRLNGLETVASSTSDASVNRDRGFDFNVFASELFNSIVVHKTAEASLDEGSLGAVVDLNTGNPLGGKAGFTGVVSAQATYNDLSETAGPRVAGLLSWKNPDGTFGVAVSGAYQHSRSQELGNNTVRWAQSRFDSVAGVPCFYTTATSTVASPNTGGQYRRSAGCDAVALAFHPRIPRYSYVGHDRERIGLTGSVQWAPSDATRVSIDGLFSRFKAEREEKHGEVLFRSNERPIDVASYQIDADNNLISGTFNDVYVRTEHYLRRSRTDFYQLGGSWDQDITDTLRITLLGGFSKSDADIPRETTIMFDDKDAQGYSYDYTDMQSPKLTFGTSVTDPSVFQLSEIRDVPSNVTNRFRTAQLRGEWDAAEGFTVAAGGVYRRFNFDVAAFSRNTLVCPAAGRDVVLGTITCSAPTAIGATAVYGFPVTSTLAELWNVGSSGQPSGNTNQFLIANLDAAAAFTNLYGRPLIADITNNRSVVEEVKGGYLQFKTRGELLGLRFAADAGIRYVRTAQQSTGITVVNAVNQTVTVDRDYDDWLPAVNVALFPTETVILRGAVAQVITRPDLGNLTPGGSIDAQNFRVTFGNPFIEPVRATSYDLAAEWYFARGSLLSAALFRKDVSSFPVSQTTQGVYADTGLPLSILPNGSPLAANPNQQITIQTLVNGSGATLKGVELQLQTPFRFLPGILRNFGIITNATFIQSNANYSVIPPSTTPVPATGATGGGAAVPVAPTIVRSQTFFGLSKRTFNVTLYYEDSRFSARSSVSYRSRFVDGISGTGNQFEGFNPTLNVDASVRYRLTDWAEIALEGINLTDQYRERFTDIDADRNYEYNHFGRTIQAGVRLKI